VNIDVIRPRDLPENLAQCWAQAVEGLALGGVSALPGKVMRRYDLLRALR